MTNEEFVNLYRGRKVRILVDDTDLMSPRFKRGDIGIISDLVPGKYPIVVELSIPRRDSNMEFKQDELKLLKVDPLPLPG